MQLGSSESMMLPSLIPSRALYMTSQEIESLGTRLDATNRTGTQHWTIGHTQLVQLSGYLLINLEI